MSGPSELAMAAGVLVDAGLKSTVLLGGAWAVTRLWSGSAAQRHAVWAAVLASLPLLPLLAVRRGADIALQAEWVAPVWMLGVIAALVPLLWGLVGVRRLTRQAEPHGDDPGVYVSASIAGPATWGALCPVILLPPAARAWPAHQLQAALTHERAHIARGDWAVHLLARVVCALLWFQPLVWLARRELCLEAEHAADDVVLRSGVRPSVYAELLLSVACGKPPPAALGAGSSLLGRRVHAVLGRRARGAGRWPVIAAVVLLSGILVPGLASWPAWSAPPPDTLTCR